ncbi:YeeE/YedE thiosulfate transporter family protein [Syntrophomonas erecta]
MQDHQSKSLNPYVAGSLTGLLIVLSAAITGNYFGSSTSFIQFAGMIEKLFDPVKVSQMKYFSMIKPVLSWQTMFVTGILLGSFIAATIFGDFKWRFIPDLWQKTLGTSRFKRGVVAFLGGIIAMFGARLAGGCPAGQMSSSILLSVSGWASMIVFFAVGIMVARIIHRGGGANDR